MMDSTITQLRREIDELRDLVVQLSNMILRIVVQQRAVPQLHSRQQLPSSTVTLSPTEIVPQLRETALLCARVSRENANSETARELESLSIELADAARRLAAVFAIPDGKREGGAS